MDTKTVIITFSTIFSELNYNTVSSFIKIKYSFQEYSSGYIYLGS